MTEREAIAYIETYGWSKTRLGLGRTRELLARLGDPQKGMKFIHVAGSNGKGSACAMFEAIARAAGYKTGLYISPYLETFRERIQVDGEMIPGAALANLTERVKAAAGEMEDHPSQFELATAIAFLYYREQHCDIVVLEVGMGGALDSTNAIDAPELAVICNIGLEHTEYLGNTIEEIAATKAGIIKPGCACVCYDGAAEAVAVVRDVCAERGVPFRLSDFNNSSSRRLRPVSASLFGQRFTWDGTEYELALAGPHQLRNAALVLTGVETLRARGWNIPDAAVAEGLRTVRWPARMEVLSTAPLFLLDGGHNPQCAAALAESFATLLPGKKALFLTGVLADKDYETILKLLLPFAKRFVCVTPESPRALPAEALRDCLKRGFGAEAEAAAGVPAGVLRAIELAETEGTPVVAFGSLYLAGAVRRAFPEALKQRRGRALDPA